MLQPLLSRQFDGAIWRLEVDESSDLLIAEIRNEQQKQVSFASVDLLTGEICFDNLTTDERWLTGVECIYNGIALLHYYKHETGPEHKGIIAIDARTAKQLWANYSLAFDHLSVNGPVAYQTNLQPKKMLLADIDTGNIIRSYEAADKPLPNSIILPSISSAAQIVPGTLPGEPFGNIVHSLNYNTYRIVSLHTLKNGLLQQHLFIMDGSGIVYHDLLNNGIQKLQPEAFVLHKNALVYIKNKTELNILKL